MLPPLACSVRECGLPLVRTDLRYVCPKRHSYDIARSGYVNLLQAHDRRSAAPGDDRDTVAARARLLDAGIGASLLEAVVDVASSLALAPRAGVLDIGSGSGHLLALMSRSINLAPVGVDISVHAAGYAARRYSNILWLVANADRRLPLTNASVGLVVSTHARRNPPECARVLEPGGFLLMAVPATDDLGELRAAVQHQMSPRDRLSSLVELHSGDFDMAAQRSVREQHQLEGELLRDLLHVSYRGRRRSEMTRAEALRSMQVTLASELVLFQRRTQ